MTPTPTPEQRITARSICHENRGSCNLTPVDSPKWHSKTCDNLTNAIADALSSATQEDPRWIPVGEALPEKNGDFIVYGSRGVHEARFVKLEIVHQWADEWGDRWFDVTHWMPLPKAPEVKP